MVGEQFARLLAAAQRGDEGAFAMLWRDANPAITRYLRVASSGDATDAACECWAVVVRGFPTFRGDEAAWRSSLFAAARLRAEEDALRDTWPAFPSPDGGEPGHDLDIDELFGPDSDAEAPSEGAIANRGLRDTLAALWALPRASAEVLMLGLVGELPETEVARLVGSDPSAVRETQRRALQDLGVDRDLLVWSLAAPATPAELADERTATALFRVTMGRAAHAEHAEGRRIESWRTASTDAEGWRTRNRPAEARTSDGALAGSRHSDSGHSAHSDSRHSGSRDRRRPDRRPDTRRGKDARSGPDRVVRLPSRAGRVGVAAVTAAMVGLVGMSAAAYAGALPEPVQQVFHVVIGAPPPAPAQADDKRSATKGTTQAPTSQGEGQEPGIATGAGTSAASQSGQSVTGVGPDPTGNAAPGLCRAWDADQEQGLAAEKSAAYRSLVTVVGSAAGVADYCAPYLKSTASLPGEAKSNTKPGQSGGPTSKGTGQPSDIPPSTGTGSTTETPPSTGSGTTTETPPPTTSTETPGTGTETTPNDPTSDPTTAPADESTGKSQPGKSKTDKPSTGRSQTANADGMAQAEEASGKENLGVERAKEVTGKVLGSVILPDPVSTTDVSAPAGG